MLTALNLFANNFINLPCVLIQFSFLQALTSKLLGEVHRSIVHFCTCHFIFMNIVQGLKKTQYTLQWNLNVFNLQGKRKFVQEIWEFENIEGEKLGFVFLVGSTYQEFKKKNQEFGK